MEPPSQLEKMVKTINFGPFVSDDIFSENSPDASNTSLSRKFLQELTIFYFLFLSQNMRLAEKFLRLQKGLKEFLFQQLK